ncbi:hypothetical protein NDU88_007012 [Pleurodeles waltl]|uniref:Uncharacterized protein n=1 Tax=Pleurodeles waltl TaxID=8319 RepID=A0AAV7RTJ3_PLEWA|nr:hypothetical protein NDU88_007012 [Pleurodeles waltl]
MALSARRRACLTDRSVTRHLPAGDQMLLTPGTESQPRSPSVFVRSGDDAGLQMARSSPLTNYTNGTEPFDLQNE